MVERVATEGAGFAKATVTGGRNLNGGVRHADHLTSGKQWSRRVHAVWSVSDPPTLKGGLGRGFRRPSVEQIADARVRSQHHLRSRHPYDNPGMITGNITLSTYDFVDQITSGPDIRNCGLPVIRTGRLADPVESLSRQPCPATGIGRHG